MNILQLFFLQNFSKIFSKTHQIAPFYKIFPREYAPEPPSKRSMVLCAMQIPPLFQKYSEPSPK